MTDKALPTLVIDPEFKRLIRPLLRQEYLQLERNIVRDGCRDPITTWNGIIIDGHNRYEICHRHQIPFATVAMDFEYREEVIAWICSCQLGRRNLTIESRKYLIGRQYESEKVVNSKKNATGRNQYTKPRNNLPYETFVVEKQESTPVTKRKTAESIGEQYHVSHSTVEKYGQYTKELDTIGQAEPKLLANILSGRYKISHSSIHRLAGKTPQEIRAFNQRLEELRRSHAQYQDTRAEMSKSAENRKPSLDAQVPSVKDMPAYDPDAEIKSLIFTVPSWTSSLKRAQNGNMIENASNDAKMKFQAVLVKLCRTTQELLVSIQEE